MSTDQRRERLRRMLAPRSVVYVGGGALVPAIDYARKLGFPGRIDVISTSRREIAGISCVSRAAELPVAPDLAFVAVPSAQTLEALCDLADNGVGAAIVNASGFAETSAGGALREKALREAAGDMPFIGPNCPGFSNFLDRAGMMLGNMGENDPQGRGVAVISNGGAYLADIACSDRSLPLAYIAGLGNQADVTIAELLDVILDDERVAAVNLYFESLREVSRLSRCAAKAAKKAVPIVAVQAGRSESGARAAASHTASMVDDAEIASALFARLAFIEVATASEAIETLKMLAIAGAPRGRRVGLATSSGSYAVLGADMAERVGLALPEPSPETKDAMRAHMEPFLVPGNPADIATGQFWNDDAQRRFFDAFLADDYDLCLQIMSFPSANTWDDESWYRSSALFAKSAAAKGLPAAFMAPTPEGLPKAAREMLIALGAAARLGYGDRIQALDEAEAKAALARAGVPVPRHRVLNAGADPTALDLAYPLALKALSGEIAHKSELGAVALGVPDAPALAVAIEAMRISIEGRTGLSIERFLVEEMVEDPVGELLVGIRHVADIGQALTLAIGGVATELLRDRATLLLPAARADIARALESLRLYPLQTGWRGAPAADIAGALDTIEAVCRFAADQRAVLVELEVNPLIVRARGSAVAVDALLRRASDGAPETPAP